MLTPESHIGSHARLLAGPGTGKTTTLVKRVQQLVQANGVEPNKILVLTFTRAAAASLRHKVGDLLGSGTPQDSPRISTLHAFALRQLLLNSSVVETVPRPVRIADDWEEEEIVLEDLKALLGDPDIRQTRRKLNQLSASWETLDSADPEREQQPPDAAFIGAWGEHRRIFGYTLRAELVFQLLRGLDTNPNFTLEPGFNHLLVDEYQDLNQCDLGVISGIRKKGAEVFGAGDDDQSIYGFRYAFPAGIRNMTDEYSPLAQYSLPICWRCDRSILTVGEFVAAQDYERLDKGTQPRPGAGEGEVTLFAFNRNAAEAQGIARLCTWLMDTQGVPPDEIMILLRSDRYGTYSTPLRQAIEDQHKPVSNRSAEVNPLDKPTGRRLLSYLRLKMNPADHLAWRALVQLQAGIGPKTWNAVYQRASQSGTTFSESLTELTAESKGGRLKQLREYIESVRARLDAIPLVPDSDNGDPESLLLPLLALVHSLTNDEDERSEISAYLQELISQLDRYSLGSLLEATSASLAKEEQELESGKINILTMHQAKGLEADVVIIAGAEDEQIPGAATYAYEVGDERRLLYVSLTRARKRLYLTLCGRRFGRQRYTRAKGDDPTRTLTRFLTYYPALKSVSVESYIAQF